MASSRMLKWIFLSLLLMSTLFLASFNATLRHIVAARRRSSDANKAEASKSKKAAGDGGPVEDSPASEDTAKSKKKKAAGDGGPVKESSAAEDAAVPPPEETSGAGSENLRDRDRARRQREEQRAPTPGKFTTTQRPLDGFAEEVAEEDGDGASARGHRARPSVQSRRAAPPPHTNHNSSTALLGDAHYAKALRLLSSDFDRLKNGGNALPHAVGAGEYDQAIEGKHGRGDAFVKMDFLPTRSSQRKRRRAQKKMQKMQSKSNNEEEDEAQEASATKYANWEHPEDQPILHVALDVVGEWFMDAADWFYDAVGYGDEYKEAVNDNSIHDNSNNDMVSGSYEEDVFSWRDTRMGTQLIWIYTKVASLWSRKDSQLHKQVAQTTATSSRDGSRALSEADRIAREGLFHLEKAAELGHSEAQRMVANSLASGILPLSDHSLMHRLAEWQFSRLPDAGRNWTSVLAQSTLRVPDDFAAGGEQVARALLLWHLAAMDGNVEAAMALGYRHLYSATGGATAMADLADDKSIAVGYHPGHGGVVGPHGGAVPASDYGVLGACDTALAYYEAAAHGVMDELERGPTRGKVAPPAEEHGLAEIYAHGGAAVALEGRNRPDELEEALQYYRMLASRNRSPEPDLVAAVTVANFYYHGYRGVKQDPRLALKYYEICGDYHHWEGGGQAGLMHVWGIGMTPDERDLGQAYRYFAQGTPGGLEGCAELVRQRRKESLKKDGTGEEVSICDKLCINGMGLLHLLGVEGLVDRDLNAARRWFEQGKDLDDPESMYNYAMLRLGWMVTELKDLPPSSDQPMQDLDSTRRIPKSQAYLSYRADTSEGFTAAGTANGAKNYKGPSASDHKVAIQHLTRAATKGHLQSKHKLGMLYAAGSVVPKTHGKPAVAVAQSCPKALRYFKSVADTGHTVSNRNRAAWKQYGAGDYESALRNYLAAAETGSEVGQVNAAFLLEQGHCLGMTTKACTNASIRLWRAAARQGNLEAALRVGDFYYYGRMKDMPSMDATKTGGDGMSTYAREDYLTSLDAKAFYFIPGPYRWTRYILYPEEIFGSISKWISRSVQNLRQYVSAEPPRDSLSNDGTTDAEASSSSQDTCDESEGTCSPEWNQSTEENTAEDTEQDEHMAIAAQYYRKAAEEHKSARAHFNLGFMHEWGLGLTQDFPLAKRHYDLAGEGEASMAASIALWAMDLHRKTVKLGLMLKKERGMGSVVKSSLKWRMFGA